MRVGQNPLKLHTDIRFRAEVTVGVLNCLPDLTGYFEEGLDVLKVCLKSIRQSVAEQEVDVLVVDNGSCKPVRDFLVEELSAGRIQHLVLNHQNVGEGNGTLQVLRNAPGDYVLYTDGDIFFEPGWLEAQLKVAKSFPKVGLVGGRPIRGLRDHCTSATHRWLESPDHGATIEEGDHIKSEWTQAHLASCGVDPKRDANSMVVQREAEADLRVRLDGASALVGSGHMQFLISRAAVDCIPQSWSQKAFAKRSLLDEPLDSAGYLRLSVDTPYAHHIGNQIIEPRFAAELAGVDDEPRMRGTKTREGAHWIWRQRPVRKAMRHLYSWAFERYATGD